MGGYSAAYVPYDGNMIPCMLPVSSFEESEKTKAGGRPYSVPEILRENYGENFHQAVWEYVTRTPEALTGRDVFREAYNFEVLSTEVIRTESALHQPVNCTAADIIVRSFVQGVCDREEETEEAGRNWQGGWDLRSAMSGCRKKAGSWASSTLILAGCRFWEKTADTAGKR